MTVDKARLTTPEPGATPSMGVARIQFERIATFLGLGVVLLPVIGYFTRAVAFGSGLNIDNSSMVALAAPISQLALVGFSASLISVGYLIIFAGAFRTQELEAAAKRTAPIADRIVNEYHEVDKEIEHTRREWEELKKKAERGEVGEEVISAFSKRIDEVGERKKQLLTSADELIESEEWKIVSAALGEKRESRNRPAVVRAIFNVVRGAFILGGLVLIGFGPGFFLQLFGFASSAFGYTMVFAVVPRFFKRSRTLGILLTMAGIMLIGAFGTGLNGFAGEFLASYSFKPEPHLADGTYTQIGDDGSAVYLQPCHSSQLVWVGKVDIAHATTQPLHDLGTQPSLVDMIFGGKHLHPGYQPEC